MTLKQQKPNLVLFLGSGFTRGLWKKAPTMDNLFASVLRELRNFKDRCLTQLLSEIMAEHFPQISKSDWSEINFEVFLTRIDDLKKKAKRTSTAQKGQDIEEFWRWLVAATGRAVHKSIPYGDYEDKRKQRKMAALIELLTAAKAKSKSVSIITTNYDLFLDKAVGRIIDKGLHGAHVTYDIAFRHLKRHQYGVPLLGIWSQNKKGKPIRIDNGEDWKRLPQEIQIYKLHGSVNWAYCECCQGIYGNFSFADLKRIFSPEKVTCPSCKKQLDWLILPPTQRKQSNNRIISKVQKMAARSLVTADSVVFIGYSIPETDFNFNSLLLEARASAAQHGRNWKYWIIDQKIEVHDKYKRILGKANNQGNVDDFDPDRFKDNYLQEVCSM